jgi:hypothetical protein
VQRLFSSFPGESAGAALLILRVCLATSLLQFAWMQFKADGALMTALALAALSIAIGVGAFLPVCCSLAVMFQLAAANASGWNSPLLTVIGALQTAALALLGAGAYSVDARLFGRRVVYRGQ